MLPGYPKALAQTPGPKPKTLKPKPLCNPYKPLKPLYNPHKTATLPLKPLYNLYEPSIQRRKKPYIICKAYTAFLQGLVVAWSGDNPCSLAGLGLQAGVSSAVWRVRSTHTRRHKHFPGARGLKRFCKTVTGGRSQCRHSQRRGPFSHFAPGVSRTLFCI